MRRQRFADRAEAGAALARLLADEADERPLVVAGLARGGVPVAAPVARALDAPLDVMVVRKLGVPSQPELAFGAIAEGGGRVLNRTIINGAGLDPDAVEQVTQRERATLADRVTRYRGEDDPLPVGGRTVILVDDGLATGATMTAAVRAVRARSPDRVVVAVPVAAAEIVAGLAAEADQVVCARTPDPLYAVGVWYRDFDPTTDDEVQSLLDARPARGRDD